MSNLKRIINILIALLMLAAALALTIYTDYAIPFILAFTGIGFTIKGLSMLFYYFSTARFMVGGKTVLYRGILLLELGLFASSIANHPGPFVILYLASINLYSGVVQMLRVIETFKLRSKRWMLILIHSLFYFATGIGVIYAGIFLKRTDIAAYAYSLGLTVSALSRIRLSFTRTDIVYIQ
ncbi:MAG: hypothetical protein E7219_05590 [Clostridiales bacterium]|nr:hypothetical protein [Clostridiales bacterium]